MPKILSLMIALAAGLISFASTEVKSQQLYGLTVEGDLVQLNEMTGQATLIGPTGFAGTNAAAADSNGTMYSIVRPSVDLHQVISIDTTTGSGTVVAEAPACSDMYTVRAMAIDSGDNLYVALSQSLTSEEDILARIDLSTGDCTVIGAMGLTGIQAMAFDGSDNLYCLDVGNPSDLCQVDVGTGLATVVVSTDMSGNSQALEFDSTGKLYAARTELMEIDPMTGAATLIGATGATDIRGLAFADGTPPIATVQIAINPKSGMNCIKNNGTGKITVHVFGSFEFDVTQIDPATLHLDDLPIAIAGNSARLRVQLKDENADGAMDLIAKFENMAAAFDPNAMSATLTGQLLDGTDFEGSDTICFK